MPAVFSAIRKFYIYAIGRTVRVFPEWLGRITQAGVFSCGVACFFCFSVATGQVLTLGWDPSPDAAVAGYYVYFGGASGVYTNKSDAGTNTTLAISGLIPGTAYYFTATAYSATGVESGYTPEITCTVPAVSLFSKLTASQGTAYGPNTMALAGRLCAPGALFPSRGELIVVTINGNAQTTVINDATGDFLLNYDLTAIPASKVPYTIFYSYQGDGSLTAVADASTTLTVNPAPVTIFSGISVNNRSYNGTTAATINSNQVGLNGVVWADLPNVALATNNYTAAFASSAAGQGMPVSVAGLTLTGTAAGNYTLLQPTGLAANITPATPTISVVSSLNPAGFRAGVTFTAWVLTNGTTAGDATGTIQLQTSAGVWRSVGLSTGTAAAALPGLPRGTNALLAVYSGDGNYLAATSGILNEVVTNHPPVAATFYVSRSGRAGLLIPWSNISSNWSDPDGDPLTGTVPAPVTTNAVTVQTNGIEITYPASAPNVNDQLNYVVSDELGGTNIGVIEIVANPFPAGHLPPLVSVTATNAMVDFEGIPGYRYEVCRSTNLIAENNWVTIVTQQAGPDGTFRVIDNFADLGGDAPGSAFYKLAWNP